LPVFQNDLVLGKILFFNALFLINSTGKFNSFDSLPVGQNSPANAGR